MIYTLTMNPAVDKTAELEEIICGGLNRLNNVMMDAGGKGINVSKTIQALQGESIAFGVLAGNSGAYIEKELDRLHIAHDFMYIEGNTRTNLKIVDKNKELTEFNESGPSPDEKQLNLLSQKIEDTLKEGDILVISGSVPSKVRKNYYYDLIKIAQKKKAKTILDADGELFKEGVKAIPSIIKPNRYELLQYFNKDESTTEKELIELAKTFVDKGIELVVVSMGKEGAYFISKDKTMKVKALKVEAHSSVGAGDAMVAALAYGYKEKSFEDLIKLCTACGAGAVMTKGTKPAERSLIDKLIQQVEYEEIK